MFLGLILTALKIPGFIYFQALDPKLVLALERKERKFKKGGHEGGARMGHSLGSSLVTDAAVGT